MDPAKTSLTGVHLGQAVVVAGGEYGTGMIRTTFAAMPHRLVGLAAKAVLLVGLVLVAGAVAVLGSVLAGRFVLGGTRPSGAVAGQRVGGARGDGIGAVSRGLIALLGLDLATALRDSTVAVGVVLGLLYVFPIITSVVTDPTWHRHLEQIAPMSAGLAVQATTGLSSLPIGPWAGLGVLAAWAAGAVLLGGLVLRLRDA